MNLGPNSSSIAGLKAPSHSQCLCKLDKCLVQDHARDQKPLFTTSDSKTASRLQETCTRVQFGDALLQVADVSQFGDVYSSQSLFIPRGARAISSHQEKTEASRRDTGTVAGVVSSPPQTFYRYAMRHTHESCPEISSHHHSCVSFWHP